MERMRRAVVTDAVAVATVHRLSRAAYYGLPADPDDDRAAMWSALLGEEDRTTWIAEGGNDEVVGFVSASRRSGTEGRVELTALYVLPDHGGRGLGSRLYETFVDERGEDEGVLEVWAGNQRAIDFYVRRGWTPTEARRPGPQDRPFVTYRLPSSGWGNR